MIIIVQIQVESENSALLFSQRVSSAALAGRVHGVIANTSQCLLDAFKHSSSMNESSNSDMGDVKLQQQQQQQAREAAMVTGQSCFT